VYTPFVEINPHAAPAQPEPVKSQEIMRLGFEFAVGVNTVEYAAVVPAGTEDGPFNAKENVLVTVMLATPLLDGSATLTARTKTVGGMITTCGAVYVPEESTVPHVVPLQPSPEIIQRTPRFGWPAEFTVPVSGPEAPSSTGIVCGETETEMSPAIVTNEAALFVTSTVLVAFTVTEAGDGSVAGAVYMPVESIVPNAALPPAIPFTVHVTAEFVALPTVAVNFCGSPRRTDAVAGETVTEIFEGGSCGELTSPPQPRNDATRSSAGHQRD
jgi:hypothetical protein